VLGEKAKARGASRKKSIKAQRTFEKEKGGGENIWVAKNAEMLKKKSCWELLQFEQRRQAVLEGEDQKRFRRVILMKKELPSLSDRTLADPLSCGGEGVSRNTLTNWKRRGLRKRQAGLHGKKESSGAWGNELLKKGKWCLTRNYQRWGVCQKR